MTLGRFADLSDGCANAGETLAIAAIAPMAIQIRARIANCISFILSPFARQLRLFLFRTFGFFDPKDDTILGGGSWKRDW